MSRMLQRYADHVRMNHWTVAVLFFCAALSGLAVFHPALFALTLLFGGGAWTRVLHPFFGVLMVLAFAVLFGQVWRENTWRLRDTAWLRAAPRLIATGAEQDMPPAGKYNAGQKLVFWAFAGSLALLLLTGVVFWQPWFADYFGVPLRRVTVVLHAISAVVLILSVVTHIYAAIWVKGTMGAMARGVVSERWARRNHPLWYREMKREPGAER
jgi:formate dehydrogenase subunit gamma